MRVMKSLLLGAAAGLAATAGVQAADLPVKAKPVEYVKICSAYGAGFYYIPGTDICLRVGGYVYAEYGVKATGGVPHIYNTERIDADYNYTGWRTSARVILDARQNTAYGTLRTYLVTGTTNHNSANEAGLDAAFIQFAGWTWGFTDSFFSFAKPGYVVTSPSFATDWTWTNVLTYTAQLGNGVTASLGIEAPERRRSAILSAVAGTAGYGGRWAPDVVGNINVTQAWGRAQIMGALHQVKVSDPAVGIGAESEWGWAIGAGIELKTPQTGNANNSFILQGAWTEGAIGYTGIDGGAAGSTTATIGVQNRTPIFLFPTHDAFVTAAGNVVLTEAWSAYAGYRHYWTPMLRTGFNLGYVEVDGGNGDSLEAWQANVSTIWSPVAGLDLSLDIVYSDVSATPLGGVTSNSDIWASAIRLRRNF